MDGIYFPGIGVFFDKVPEYFDVFGFKLTIYAIVITLGFVLALLVASKEAKRTGQDDENYLDFFLVLVIPAILGARIYYILFNPGRFFQEGKSIGQTIIDLINIRNGGLAVYGGLIAGVTAAFFFTKKKKLYLPLFGDTIAMGVLVGQILGRCGNFFNREAYGAFTSGPLRMAIPINHFSIMTQSYLQENGILTEEMLQNKEMVKGVSCFTVHPTFLYEVVWNIMLLLVIFFYRKKKKFDGELSMMYVAGYGLGRFFIEALRSDSLMIGPLKISQVVAVLCVIVAMTVIIKNRLDIKNGKTPKINYAGEGGVKSEDDSKTDSKSSIKDSKKNESEKDKTDKKESQKDIENELKDDDKDDINIEETGSDDE